MRLKIVLLGTVAALLTHGAWADSIVYPSSGTPVEGFGPNYVGLSFGEYFVAPQDVLNNFSFVLEGTTGSFPIVGQVYAWNEGAPVGAPLFTSSVRTLAYSTTFQTVEFDTDNLDITADQKYVAVVTNQPYGVSLGGSGYGEAMLSSVPSLPGRDSLASGFTFTSGNPSTGLWCVDGCFENATFTANFSSAPSQVPEPATVGLLGSAMIGLVMTKRKVRNCS